MGTITDTPRTTRDVLMDTAEVLFAERGVQGATTREIVEAARQRNASALTYHFGSRENLLLEILARRGGPVDAGRARLRAGLGEAPATSELVWCLVEPYAADLDSPGGRAYLRIVAQLRGRFASWRVESDESTTVSLTSILGELEQRAPGSPEVREAHLLGMITLLTGLVAQRAHAIDRGRAVALSHQGFCAEVTDMCTSVISC